MDITFVTSANSDIEAMQLLSELGLPFKKKDERPVAETKPSIKETPEVEAAVEETPEVEAAVEETPEFEAAVEDTSDQEDIEENNKED